jgi:hypothetical protein
MVKPILEAVAVVLVQLVLLEEMVALELLYFATQTLET